MAGVLKGPIPVLVEAAMKMLYTVYSSRSVKLYDKLDVVMVILGTVLNWFCVIHI